MSIPLPLWIRGLRRPREDALHLQLDSGQEKFGILVLMAKPMAGTYVLTGSPYKGSEPHGSQGPWRHRLLGRKVIGLRSAPGLWELQLDDGQVLALNWRRRQAGIRLVDEAVLGGDWRVTLPCDEIHDAGDLIQARRQEEVETWRLRERRRLEKQMEALSRPSTVDPNELRDQGQRLSSLRGKVVQHKDAFLIPDYDPTTPLQKVDRRPGESLQGRVDRCYKDARREERRHERGIERLRFLERRLHEIQVTEPPVRAIKSTQQQKLRSEKGIRRYCLRSGREVLVGRDAKANHHLTFSLSRGRDLWFHRRNGPGPHVLLRRDRDEVVPEEEMVLAAALALRFGPRGTDVQEEVRWTERRFVDPIPGQPGRVLVRKERVLLVDQSQHRDAIELLLSR